ncbi:MAG: DUF3899 domain-containing protein [Mycoplasma sp.]|nr:DUF3899 domain-containing protein [Mycoplasma sp.]
MKLNTENNKNTLLNKTIGQIIIALFWCLFFGLSYGLNKFPETKLKNAIIIPSVICLCLNIFSILFYFGLFENTIVSFKNSYINRPSKIRERKKEGVKTIKEYTLKDLKKDKSRKNFLALFIMSGVYLLSLIIILLI